MKPALVSGLFFGAPGRAALSSTLHQPYGLKAPINRSVAAPTK